MERQTFGLRELKFADDSAMTFSGYGAVFGNVDSYGDVIAKGAFKATMARHKKEGSMPLMLAQHGGFSGSDMMPIGVWTDMKEDDTGLLCEGKLAPTPRGEEAYALMKMSPRPAISGLSIGFVTKEFSLRTRPDEPRRTLKAVDLLEVSLVSMPANPKARVQSVKSAREMTIRELERALTSGTLPELTAAEAKALLAGGFKAFTDERDADRNEADELADLLRRNINLLKG